MLKQNTIAAALALGLLTACADTVSTDPIAVELPHLVAEHKAYDGRIVTVSGRVAHFDDPLHYWLEDDAFHRVALLPDASVSAMTGDQVRVTGKFTTSPDQGRQIEVTEVMLIE